MKNFLLRHKYEICLLIFITLYILYFTTASFLKQDNFYTARFDLGNMDQAVWNTIHGRIFQITDSAGTEITSRLAFHADFILILLSPLYLIWESPKMLLLVQTIVLSIGAVFVYLIAKVILKNKSLSLVFAFSYLLNPALNWINLYDFHPVALSTTFLLAAFYFLIKKKYLPMLLFLFLAGICKEQIWTINFLFGLYVLFIHKNRLLGLAISSISVAFFYLLMWKIIPQVRAEDHFALRFYSDYGESPTDIIKNILFSPNKVIETILRPDRLEFIKQLFLPLGYLSLLSPLFLIFAAPDLMIDLLSSRGSFHQIYYQYTATITPFIFISAIYGTSKLYLNIPQINPKTISVIILLFTFISAYSFGPLIFAKTPNDAMFREPHKNSSAIRTYLRSIPQDLTLSTTNDLGAHLSHRERIFTVPFATESANMVLFLIKDDEERNPIPLYDIYNRIGKNPNYKLIYNLDNFYVYKRIESPLP